MVKRACSIAGVFVLVFGLSFSARAERTPLTRSLKSKGYEKIAYKRGVTVYKHPKSNIIRLGAEGKFPYPPDKVFRALLDYGHQKGHIPRLSKERVLKKGKNWLVVYQRLNLPVISDRDFTLFVRYGKKGDTRWIEYRAVTNRGPRPQKGVVRVTLNRGSWQLRPINNGRGTFARFQVVIDLAGWVPKWMARSGSGKEVPRLFANIRKMVGAYSK